MADLDLRTVLNPHPGWYRGDFHAHTHHSDGVLTPAQLVDTARAAGLDFFAITDHNTVDAYPHFAGEPDMLVIPGMEVTFTGGHFNLFGLQDRYAWMERVCTSQRALPLIPGPNEPLTTTALMREMEQAGLLISINHPLLRPWAWEYGETELGPLHCLEIWNDPSWPDNKRDNPRAVHLWTDLLNEGYRITAIGGSDFHRPTPRPGEKKPAERLGTPSTYVYAAALSGRAILEGLRQRRAYVSMGPTVTFSGRVGEAEYGMGDDAGDRSGEIVLRATVTGSAEPARAQLVRNGEVILEVPVRAGAAELSCEQMLEHGRPQWFRLDVWDDEGLIQAVTNPIYAGPQVTPTRRIYAEMVADITYPVG